MSQKYWVVINGNRFKERFYNNNFSGMIDFHPFDYIRELKKVNAKKKGYNRIFETFILMSWQKVSDKEWEKYPDDKLGKII